MSDLLPFAIWTLGWTLGGGVVGYIFGRLTVNVHRIANQQEGVTVDAPEPDRPPLRRDYGRLLIGLLIVILGVGTAVQGIITSNRVEHLQQCQARYSNQFADALDARTASSSDSQQAMDNLVSTIGANLGGNTRANQQAIGQAVQRYLDQRRAAKQQRVAHPYPAPPREACHE